jgi:hypothetical protein
MSSKSASKIGVFAALGISAAVIFAPSAAAATPAPAPAAVTPSSTYGEYEVTGFVEQIYQDKGGCFGRLGFPTSTFQTFFVQPLLRRPGLPGWAYRVLAQLGQQRPHLDHRLQLAELDDERPRPNRVGAVSVQLVGGLSDPGRGSSRRSSPPPACGAEGSAPV